MNDPLIDLSVIFADNWYSYGIQMHARRGVVGILFGIRMYPPSLSPPLFLILPGVASVSGAVIYHPPLGVAAGVEAKNLTEQKLSSVLGKAS